MKDDPRFLNSCSGEGSLVLDARNKEESFILDLRNKEEVIFHFTFT